MLNNTMEFKLITNKLLKPPYSGGFLFEVRWCRCDAKRNRRLFTSPGSRNPGRWICSWA